MTIASITASIGWFVLALFVMAMGAWGLWVARRRWRRSRFAEYGFELRTFQLPQEGKVDYAQWLHPKERPKIISQDDVTGLRRYVRPGDTVLDIGAHTGALTLPFALAAGPGGMVIALEPNPYVFKILLKNAGLNRDKTNIVPLNFAATTTDGTFKFHYSDGAFCNGGFLDQLSNRRHKHRQPLEVQGRNLETLLRRDYGDRLRKLSFIKIDTEGYDRQVIQSMLGIVREFQPVIMCEIYKRLTLSERQSQFDLLTHAGYRSWAYVGGAKLLGNPLERKDLLREPHFDLIALPGRLQSTMAA